MNDSTSSSPPSPPPPRRRGIGRTALHLLFIGSLLLNFVLCGMLGSIRNESDDLSERRLYGEESSKRKIAVVRIDGILMEGMINYYVKQIEQAAKDDQVKAVVLRIDSPGGTISASEGLHRLLTQMRDGRIRKYPDSKPKKLFISMGAIAASGGYYIAMPGEKVFAEKTCITGSIGVYASLPNVADLINRNGVKFELIKAGAIKASGSPFHTLSQQERQPWQAMVDDAYGQFLDVVAAGRPALNKAALRDDVVVREMIDVHDDKGNIVADWWGLPRRVEYSRRRADGGSFTAAEAKKFGLIDEIGDLDEVVSAAAAAAQLSKYEVIVYDRHPSLINSLLGLQAKQSSSVADPARLANGLAPRLWCLAPEADLAGILAAMARE